MDHMPVAIKSLYLSGQSPQLDMFFHLLDLVTKQNFEATYLVVDGLDESPDRRLFLDGIQQLCQEHRPTESLKILLSSRPEYDIRQTLSMTPFITIQPQHVKSDMETHVRAELAKMPQLRAMPDIAQEDLITDLVSCAAGMFRWISCQVDALRNVRTPQALKEALRTLPAGLDETYDRILNSVRDDDTEYVLRVLHWLIDAERPLCFNELAEAVALNPQKELLDPAERLLVPEEIFELCGSLIRVEEDQTVVLAHLSVKDLLSGRLQARNPTLAKFALRSDHSRQHVSVCMLSYVLTIGLRIQSLKEVALNEEEFPLLSYTRLADISCFRDFNAVHIWMIRH